MKLTIEGSPARIQKVVNFIAELDEAEREAYKKVTSEAFQQLGKSLTELKEVVEKKIEERKENPLRIADPVQSEPQAVADLKAVKGAKAPKEKTPKVEKVDAADKDPEDPNAVTLVQVQELSLEKVQLGHKDKILAELAKRNAKKHSELDPKEYNSMYVFLQAL